MPKLQYTGKNDTTWVLSPSKRGWKCKEFKKLVTGQCVTQLFEEQLGPFRRTASSVRVNCGNEGATSRETGKHWSRENKEPGETAGDIGNRANGEEPGAETGETVTIPRRIWSRTVNRLEKLNEEYAEVVADYGKVNEALALTTCRLERVENEWRKYG